MPGVQEEDSVEPGAAQEKYRQAQALYRAGSFKEAMSLVNELDEAFPNSKDILFAQASLLNALGRKKEAANLCERLIVQFADERAERLKAAISLGETGAATPAVFPSKRPFEAVRRRPLFFGVLASCILVAVVAPVGLVMAGVIGRGPAAAGEIRNFAGIDFVWCPPGQFMMGSAENEKYRSDNEGPRHKVTW
jgi:formylglycine-generating enzyme required for sulfatase activity